MNEEPVEEKPHRHPDQMQTAVKRLDREMLY